MSKRIIVPLLLLCLLLTACGQNALQEQLNSGPSLSTSTLPTTVLPTSAAETTSALTTAPSINSTTVPTTVKPTTATKSTTASTVVPATKQTTVPPTVVPTTSATTTSGMLPLSTTLLIKNREQYNNLLQAAKDEQFYRDRSEYTRVFKTHKDLIAFVNLLERLPGFQVSGAQYMTLKYIPGASRIQVEKVIDQNHFYRFYFYYVNQENAARDPENLSKLEDVLETKIMVTERGNVVALTQYKEPAKGAGWYCCYMDVDGWLVRFDVINKDGADLSKQSIKEAFSVVTFEEKFQWS